VAYLLKARIVEPEETVVAGERLCKQIIIAAAKATRNNRGTVGGGVLCAVHAEAL
jgi:hypothetical protein